MSEIPTSTQGQAGPEYYRIRLRGHLDARWAGWFENLSLTQESDGTTTLSGPVVDQAALHGVLNKVRDLGVPLIAVNVIEDCNTRPGIQIQPIRCGETERGPR